MFSSMQRKIERNARRFGTAVSGTTRSFRERASRATNLARRSVQRFFRAPAQGNISLTDFYQRDESPEEIMSKLDETIKKIKRKEVALQTESSQDSPHASQLLGDILSSADLSIDPEKERRHLDELRQQAYEFSMTFNNTVYGEKCNLRELQKNLRAITSELEDKVTKNRANVIINSLDGYPSVHEIKAVLMDLYKLGGEPDERMNDVVFFHPFTNPYAKPIKLATIKYKCHPKDSQFKEQMKIAANSIDSDDDKKQFTELTRAYLDAPTTSARKTIAGQLKALLADSTVTELSSSEEDSSKI